MKLEKQASIPTVWMKASILYYVFQIKRLTYNISAPVYKQVDFNLPVAECLTSLSREAN